MFSRRLEWSFVLVATDVTSRWVSVPLPPARFDYCTTDITMNELWPSTKEQDIRFPMFTCHLVSSVGLYRMLPASFVTNRFLTLTCLIVSSLGFYQILSASFEELTVLDICLRLISFVGSSFPVKMALAVGDCYIVHYDNFVFLPHQCFAASFGIFPAV